MIQEVKWAGSGNKPCGMLTHSRKPQRLVCSGPDCHRVGPEWMRDGVTILHPGRTGMGDASGPASQ